MNALEAARVLTVTQLNLYVKSLLESSTYLKNIYISGEISNFTNHYRTGHLYFSLKDNTGIIKAVMFKSSAVKLKFNLQNGMKVICRGRVSLYERDGQYQLYVEEMQPDGVGALNLAFEQLTEKLRTEGLFDEAKKRKIPSVPSRIAVITSPTGAAVRDILSILKRRFPIARVIMCPVLVQGDGAPPQLIVAIEDVNRYHCADVIIIGRGGGSLEELWAFNDEGLARAIRSSSVPVISAVGHETDFTICDFASDLRAPTPSAAAELCVPDQIEILNFITNRKTMLYRSLKRQYEIKRLHLKSIMDRPALKSPMYLVDNARQRLDKTMATMTAVYVDSVKEYRNQLSVLSGTLDALSPLKVLSRGYAIPYHDGKLVRSLREIDRGDTLTVMISDGEIKAVVSETITNGNGERYER
ncbi:MAG: exodeoxyribonuclease VII large subunit [Clostridiales bacterium 43-6]|nr:MAG: exodeoxyribonuclease VII large subunit [Clostridiales bacterium 43-6]